MLSTILMSIALVMLTSLTYLQIGSWLGRLMWWSWHVDDRKNRVLAWVLFPGATWAKIKRTPPEELKKERHRRGLTGPDLLVDDYLPGERKEYLSVKAFAWPITPLFTTIVLPIKCLSLLCALLVKLILGFLDLFEYIVSFFVQPLNKTGSSLASVTSLIWTMILEGPITVWRRHKEETILTSKLRIAENASDMSTSQTQVEDPKLTEYRRLLSLREEVIQKRDAELSPIETRISEMEAEDAASTEPFRTEPLEAPARKA